MHGYQYQHTFFTDQPAVEDMLVESGFYAKHFDVS